jgi:3',5'-cyclic AMP phosphodiesterase CpdA
LFRLLHASDLHLAATPFLAGGLTAGWLQQLTGFWRQTSHNPAVLKAFVEFAYTNRQAFDALVITGDLATTGDRHDLKAAYDLFSAPAHGLTCLTSSGQPTLDYWSKRKALDLLPGNHDRYRAASNFYRPGGRVFDKVFCPPGRPSFWCVGQSVDLGISVLRGNARLQIFKADFTLPRHDRGKLFCGLPGWLGQGRVRPALLARLAAQTQQWRDDSLLQGVKPVSLWALHFDPFSTDATLQLLGSDLLAQAAQAAGVTAILCGHTHESKIKPLSDTTTVYACGTTAQAGSPHNDCQVLEIDAPDDWPAGPTVGVTWCRYDAGTGRFRPLMTR